VIGGKQTVVRSGKGLPKPAAFGRARKKTPIKEGRDLQLLESR